MYSRLQLAKEYKKTFVDRYDFRIYYTVETSTGKQLYFWHFAFPKSLVGGACPMIEGKAYWANEHWADDGGFYIWHVGVITENNELPKAQLQPIIDEYTKKYNQFLSFAQKVFGLDKPKE